MLHADASKEVLGEIAVGAINGIAKITEFFREECIAGGCRTFQGITKIIFHRFSHILAVVCSPDILAIGEILCIPGIKTLVRVLDVDKVIARRVFFIRPGVIFGGELSEEFLGFRTSCNDSGKPIEPHR
jgi:hypothetical protein